MLIAFVVALVASCVAFALANPSVRAATSICIDAASRTGMKARQKRTDSSIDQMYLERDRYLASLPARRRLAMADVSALLATNRVVALLLAVDPVHLHSVWLFGSGSIGSHCSESDLDIAVYYHKGIRPRLFLGLSLLWLRSQLLLEYGILPQFRLIPSDYLTRADSARTSEPWLRPMSGICAYTSD